MQKLNTIDNYFNKIIGPIIVNKTLTNYSSKYFNELIPPTIMTKIEFKICIYFMNNEYNTYVKMMLVNLLNKFAFEIKNISTGNCYIFWYDKIEQKDIEHAKQFLEKCKDEILNDDAVYDICYSYEWI